MSKDKQRPITPEEHDRDRNFWEYEMRKLEDIWDEQDLCEIEWRAFSEEEEERYRKSLLELQNNLADIAMRRRK